MEQEDTVLVAATLEGLKALHKRLDAYIAKYQQILDGRVPVQDGIGTVRDVVSGEIPFIPKGEEKPKAGLSDYQKERIRSAQKERWARYHAKKAAEAKAAKKKS